MMQVAQLPRDGTRVRARLQTHEAGLKLKHGPFPFALFTSRALKLPRSRSLTREPSRALARSIVPIFSATRASSRIIALKDA
jgi:hypothetical protein